MKYLVTTCALCGEHLTAPVFIGGKPFGFSCASKVQTGFKKPKVKSLYVKADAFTGDFASNLGKLEVVAKYNGQKFKDTFYSTSNSLINNGISFYKASGMQFDGVNVYIDLLQFAPKKKSLSSISI